MNISRFARCLSLFTLLLGAPLAQAAQDSAIPSPPQLAAKSYVLLDAASGKVLVENNGDQRLPPASLTKLMTAYIATLEIRKGKIGEQDLVTVSEHAWRTGGAASGGSTMFLPINSQVKVDDLLHGIIIQSGNDASVAVAEHIAGSEDAFADMMNTTAEKLGMTGSHFMNATGQIKAGLADDLTMTMPKGQLKRLQASMTMNPQLTAPIAKGDVIGKVEVKLDENVVHSADLIALDGVEEGGFIRRMWDSIRLFFYGLFN